MKYFLLFLTIIFATNCGFAQTKNAEKIYVHTDRNIYAPGDTIWLKTYVLDIDTKLLSQKSRVAYIEFKDQIQKTKIKISILNGTGNGQIKIPRTWKVGSYVLNAYTKLIEADSIKHFRKMIVVQQAGVPVTLKTTNKNIAEFLVKPEGGKLLSGFSNKVAYQLNIPLAQIKGSKGSLYNKAGTEINSFYPSFNGGGQIIFTPEAGEKYIVKIKTKTKTYEQKLPEIDAQGLNINVNNVISRDEVFISILNASNEPDSVYMEVWQDFDKIYGMGIYTDNNKYSINLKKNMFNGDGAAVVKLYDRKRELISQRPFFINQEQNPQVNINKTKVGATETVEIELLDRNDEPLKNTNLSVSISRNDKNLVGTNNMYGQLNIQANIIKREDNIDTLIDMSPTVSAFFIDNILLSNELVPAKNSKIAPEVYINFRAKALAENEVLKNEKIDLYFNEKYRIKYLQTTTNDSGYVNVSGQWSDSLTVIGFRNTGQNIKLVGEEVVAMNKPKLSTLKTTLPEPAVLKTDVRRRAYAGRADLELKIIIADTAMNFVNYLISNKGKTSIDTLLSNQGFKEDLMVLYDGKICSAELMNVLKLSEVAVIDILNVKEKLKVYNKSTGAIINIISKSKKNINHIYEKYQGVNWVGFSPALVFYTKNRTVSSNNTILWNTEAKTDAKGKVKINMGAYNKLIPYTIQVSGVDAKGRIIYHRGEF